MRSFILLLTINLVSGFISIPKNIINKRGIGHLRVISEPSKTEVARDDDQNNGLGVRLCNSIPAKLPLLDPIFQNEKYQINDYGPTVDISGMKVNPFGFYTFIVSIMSALPYYLGLTLTRQYLESKPSTSRDNYASYDNVGKLWSKGWLSATFSYPEIINPEKLTAVPGGCLIVANHASWLDIPALCTVLDRPFKFIAKGELTKVPLIGMQLEGGKHVLITREDRRSQLKTFKEAIGYLNSGIPIMAFPEGGRTEDGRLGEFKNGVFSMAVKTGVPIIPITICNANAVMPKDAMFPVQPGLGKVRIIIHDQVDVEGKVEEGIKVEVREKIKSALPISQWPVEE